MFVMTFCEPDQHIRFWVYEMADTTMLRARIDRTVECLRWPQGTTHRLRFKVRDASTNLR
jgi:hypothetical protein